jgi:electron transport complex protein RnfB
MTATTADLAARIDSLLPQTQCRLCGYAGCRPYAEAVAAGHAGINQCPPGGDDCARELAAAAGVAFQPVDPRFGTTKPPAAAVIDEALCIGCTLCIEACPVDAIVGATKLMHTVIAIACTGCELCIAPCPVDCISMEPTGARTTRQDQRNAASAARLRFDRRNARRTRELAGHDGVSRVASTNVNEQIVQKAIERARLRLATRERRGK